MERVESKLSEPRRSVLVPLGALGLALAALSLQGGSSSLRAEMGLSGDLDRDGLLDCHEATLGTSPWIADTDGDGVTDGVEVASQTSPWNPADFPAPGVGHEEVGLFAWGDSGSTVLTLVIATCDGDLEARQVGLELLRPGAGSVLPATRLLAAADTHTEEVASGCFVSTVDVRVPELFVRNFGGLAAGATIGPGNGAPLAARATLDLSVRQTPTGKFVLFRRKAHLIPPASLTVPQQPGSGQSIHQPIPASGGSSGGSDLPPSWLAGKVCFQRLETVGVSGNGLTIIKEVVEAYCDGNWNSWCDADCPGTVGQTVEVLDPGALIGG